MPACSAHAAACAWGGVSSRARGERGGKSEAQRGREREGEGEREREREREGGRETGGGRQAVKDREGDRQRKSERECVFFGSDLGKLTKPSYQTVPERALGIRNQSSPVLRLSHIAVR